MVPDTVTGLTVTFCVVGCAVGFEVTGLGFFVVATTAWVVEGVFNVVLCTEVDELCSSSSATLAAVTGRLPGNPRTVPALLISLLSPAPKSISS